MLLASLVSGAAAEPGGAQVVRVEAEENFRLEPNGTRLATLAAGTELDFVEARDTWVRATLDGWVWAASLQSTDRNGFDLVVSASGGENLREHPRGRVLGRLSEGTLLDEIERSTGWVRVQRTGWIWRVSVEVDETRAPSSRSPEVDREADGGGATPPGGRAT
ncbi:MAG: hypothetical protein RQ745_13995, partial [Longimicrobiales bacterium]|nr:hypothetical protein [Longimicrobiales bacterium]